MRKDLFNNVEIRFFSDLLFKAFFCQCWIAHVRIFWACWNTVYSSVVKLNSLFLTLVRCTIPLDSNFNYLLTVQLNTFQWQYVCPWMCVRLREHTSVWMKWSDLLRCLRSAVPTMHLAVLVTEQRDNRQQALKLNSWCPQSCALTLWHSRCPHCPSRRHKVINMQNIQSRTCRWCRHSPCRSHSSQCPVQSCMNVFCVKGRRITYQG